MDRLNSRQTTQVCLLALLASLIFFANLGAAPLWDRDEPRNAGCAAEMMQQGDWVVPIFNAELRTHKPVLLYWLMMGAYSLFGVNEFGARFCSALLSVGTVLVTYSIGRRLFSHSTGIWAGAILCTSLLFGVSARAATPDASLIFFSTLAIGVFVHAAFPRSRDLQLGGQTPANALTNGELVDGLFPRSILAACALYAVMGLGVLTKGPVGLILPTAVIGMYLLLVRLDAQPRPSGWTASLLWLLRPFAPRHFLQTCAVMRPLIAIATVGLVALPWYAWVTLRTDGEWTREFFFTHNISRATSAMEGHTGPPILFYVGAILVGCFPWSILAIPTGVHAGRALSTDPRTRRCNLLMVCWIGVYIGLFSFAQTKLPSYVTPCYPALAILLAGFVQSLTAPKISRETINWMKVGLGTLVGVGVLMLVGLPLAANRFLPGSEWLGLMGLVPLIGGLIGWHANSQARHDRLPRTLGLTAAVFAFCMAAIVPATIGSHQRYGKLFELTKQHAGPLVSFGHLEPSWIFYGQRPIREFEADDSSELLLFLNKHPDAVVLTTEERMTEAFGSPEPGSEYALVHATEYFLRDRELLLIRPHLPTMQRLADLRQRQSDAARPY